MVAVDDEAFAYAVCGAVLRSTEILNQCGLTQKRSIAVEVLDGPVSEDPSCLGVFHCGSNNIKLQSPRALGATLSSDHPLRTIPTKRLFESIVTHELAHAFIYQMRDGAGDTIAEDEYVAYAMQYLALSEDDRAAILEAMPGQASFVTRDMLNDVFLSLSPMVFGSWAWRHFSKQEDGCELIEKIIGQEIDFTVHDAFRCNDPPECTE